MAVIAHTGKVMLKILQAGFNSTWTGFKLDFKNTEDLEIKLPTSIESLKKQESSRKNIYFCSVDYAKAFDGVDYHKLWKILQ